MKTRVRHISEATGVCLNTVRNYADRGIIQARRDGRGWRFFPEPQQAIKIINGIQEGTISLNDPSG